MHHSQTLKIEQNGVVTITSKARNTCHDYKFKLIFSTSGNVSETLIMPFFDLKIRVVSNISLSSSCLSISKMLLPCHSGSQLAHCATCMANYELQAPIFSYLLFIHCDIYAPPSLAHVTETTSHGNLMCYIFVTLVCLSLCLILRSWWAPFQSGVYFANLK